MAKEYAIDIGTSVISIYAKGRGIVLSEPSCATYDSKKERVVAVGSEAQEMYGRTPPGLSAVRPVKNGVVADYEIARGLITRLFKRASAKYGFARKRVLVCFPTLISEVQRRAIEEIAYATGAAEVLLCEEPFAQAVGVGLPALEAYGSMIIDIGGGLSEVAVLSLGDVVIARNTIAAGDEMDAAIVAYLRKARNILIGEMTAERLKIEIGKVPGYAFEEAMEVSGRELTTGRPVMVRVESDEIAAAISDCVHSIVETVRAALDETPPELSADIMDSGIMLAGGGAQLRGLAELLAAETGIAVSVAEEPALSTIRGLGRILEDSQNYNASTHKASRR